MDVMYKCIKCEFRYVTEKAKTNFKAEGLKGESLLCLHCIGELTGKVMNQHGFLVRAEELESPSERLQALPRALTNCRPCMKKRDSRS